MNEPVYLADQALINESGDVTAQTTIALTGEQQASLRKAYAQGGVRLRIKAGGWTGSPDIEFTRVEGSFDGSNFITAQDFAPVGIDSAGEKAGPLVGVPLHVYRLLRLAGTNHATLDGSNHFELTAALVG